MRRWFDRLIELTQDWDHMIRRDGWQSTLPVVSRKLWELPYTHIELAVVARSLLEPLPDLKPKIALEIRAFQPSDLAFVCDEYLPSEANLCAQRLQLGHYGLVACHEGQVAGYAWGCADTLLERIDLKFEPGDVLCTDAFTAPAFRGKGVQTILSLARLRLFQDLGYKRAVAYIQVQNYPSLAVWRKVGAQVVDHIDFRRIGFWRKTRYG